METHYRNLLYFLPDIVYQLNAEGKFVYLNSSIKKLGYSPEELIGEDFTVIIDEKDRETTNLAHFLATKPPTAISPPPKFFNERRTGQRITKNLTVGLVCKASPSQPNRILKGEVFATGLWEKTVEGKRLYAGTIGVIRIEDPEGTSLSNLLRLERHYRILIENSFEIIAILAHDGTILYISNSVERNLNFPAFELIGENIETIIHPNDLSLLKLSLKNILSDLESQQKFEFRLKQRNGDYKYYETRITPILNREAEMTMCFVFHMNDISQRKQIELSALKREQMYKLLLKTSPDAILLIDNSGDIIMANDRAVVLTKRQKVELIATKFFNIITDMPEEFEDELLFHAIHEKGTIHDIPFSLFVANKKIPVEASFSVIKDNEKIIGYLAIIKDVTERKKVERAREMLEQQLLTIIIKKLSRREVELLHHLFQGYRWPKDKRKIGKIMDVLPSTLDQFAHRIKKKMQIDDITRAMEIVSHFYKWKHPKTPREM
ncbi:MAG: PAS domain S-box protein [Spirochaetes bacterium]|nr:PAS domain S-box protein [Spirochaetota bacterium]